MQLLPRTCSGKERTNGLRSIWIKVKSELNLVSAKRNTRRTSTRTIEHGTVLVQREVHGVVHVVRIGDDIFLMRDFAQALSETSDRQR